MRDDKNGGLRWFYPRCDLVGARQQQFGHDRIVADRFAIDPSLAICAGRKRSLQFQLSWDHRLGEIAFADKIRDHEDLANCSIREKKSRVAQTWFFLPKSAADIGKDF